ncbi:MAG: hypothetical protein GY756_17325 [bacterium]|nr:hypothetical protein [bacterium]
MILDDYLKKFSTEDLLSELIRRLEECEKERAKLKSQLEEKKSSGEEKP